MSADRKNRIKIISVQFKFQLKAQTEEYSLSVSDRVPTVAGARNFVEATKARMPSMHYDISQIKPTCKPTRDRKSVHTHNCPSWEETQRERAAETTDQRIQRVYREFFGWSRLSQQTCCSLPQTESFTAFERLKQQFPRVRKRTQRRGYELRAPPPLCTSRTYRHITTNELQLKDRQTDGCLS